MRRPAHRAALPPAAAAPPALVALLLLAGGLAPAACGPPPPPTGRDDLEETREHYAVSGRSGDELRWALDRLGPENAWGGRSDAVTRWHFEYTWGREEDDHGCRVSSLDTRTRITTILPRWRPDPDIAADLQRRWNDYVACAHLHETGHRRIYLDGVARFRRRVEALGDRPDCGTLDAAVNRLADEELRIIQDEQTAYEERTDHGYDQCGRFP